MKNVPNILSGIRILLVPVFIALYFGGAEKARLFAALVYVVAMATDVLDGYIARKFNFVSDLGRILDPLGDKLMAISVIACLAIDGRLPMWALAFFAAKELIMIVGGAVLHTRIHSEMPSANYLGKTATGLLFVVGISLLVFDIPRQTADIMISAVILIALIAFVSYALKFLNILKNAHNEQD